MLITKIEQQKRNKNRYNIYIDGDFYFSLSYFDVLAHRICENEQISQEKIEKTCMESEYNDCVNYLTNYCTRYVKTEKQILSKLTEKGFSLENINRAIEKAKQYNYINDELVCKCYVESQSKKVGVGKIKHQLKQYGVDEDIVENYTNGIDEMIAGQKACQKYLKGQKILDANLKQKLYRHLLGKGFCYETIKALIKNVGEEEDIE